MVAVVLLEDAVLGIAGDEAAVARLDRVPQRRRATGRLGRARDVLVVVQVLGVADRQRGRQEQNRTWPAPRRTPRRREARRGPQTGARSRARPKGPWRAQIGGRRGARAHGSRAASRGSIELRRRRTGERHAASGSEAQFRANSNRCDEDREPDQPDPRHHNEEEHRARRLHHPESRSDAYISRKDARNLDETRCRLRRGASSGQSLA